jgi:hypothetical protein
VGGRPGSGSCTGRRGRRRQCSDGGWAVIPAVSGGPGPHPYATDRAGIGRTAFARIRPAGGTALPGHESRSPRCPALLDVLRGNRLRHRPQPRICGNSRRLGGRAHGFACRRCLRRWIAAWHTERRLAPNSVPIRRGHSVPGDPGRGSAHGRDWSTDADPGRRLALRGRRGAISWSSFSPNEPG